MKHFAILLTIAVFFFTKITFAQELSTSELFSLCSKKNWDDVNQVLDRKGWIYDESSKGDDDTYSIITWAYNKNEYNNKATAWLHYFIDDNNTGRLELVFSNSSPYSKLKNELIKIGARFIKSQIENNEIHTQYETTKYIVTLKTAKTNDSERDNFTSKTFYKVSIIEKESVFDSENGLKKVFNKEGNLEAEYFLKNGELHGVAKTYYPNGKIEVISNFTNGKRSGKVSEFDENGNLDREYMALEDKFEGLYEKFYYKDDTLVLKETGRYINNKKNGTWQLLRVIGKQQKTITFENYFNGELNGPFKEIQGDSLVIGNYKSGLFNGEYKVYISLNRLFFGGEMDGDTTNKILISSGYYSNGKKTGKWKFISITKTVLAEGYFNDDEKDGTWKYYYDIYTDDSTNKSKFYSKELYLTENYKNGALNGESIRHSYLHKRITDCKTDINNTKSEYDTCYTMEYEKVLEKSNYRNDMLDGPFTIYDSLNQLRHKGNFINNKKEGLWIEGISNEGYISFSGFYLYQTGNYIDGKREGEWKYYFQPEKIDAKTNYKNGVMYGRYEEYDSTGSVSFYSDIENGYIKRVVNYDKKRAKIESKYEIILENEKEFVYSEESYLKDSTVFTTYTIKKYNNSPFPIRNFLINTTLITRLDSDETEGYKNGPYKVFSTNGNLLLEGQYYKGKKTGEWKYYNLKGKIEKTETHSE